MALTKALLGADPCHFGVAGSAMPANKDSILDDIRLCAAGDLMALDMYENQGFADEPIGSFVDCSMFKNPAFNVTAVVKSACSASGIDVLDLSDQCRPSMTVAEFFRLKSRVWDHLLQKPDDVVLVASDNHLTFEFLEFDAEQLSMLMFGAKLAQMCTAARKKHPARCASHFPGYYPTAMLWRGEDYARISSKISRAAGLKQALDAIGVSGAFECSICFADLHDGTAITKPSHSPFVCGHAICFDCSPKVAACPTCREDKRTYREEKSALHPAAPLGEGASADAVAEAVNTALPASGGSRAEDEGAPEASGASRDEHEGDEGGSGHNRRRRRPRRRGRR